MSIDKRPDGKYRARVREYPGGPERTRHFRRKVDAERWEAEMRVSLARGTYLTADESKVTFAKYRETFMGRQVWRDRTAEIAHRSLDRCGEILGADRPLSAIRRGDVESLIVKLSAEYAPGTVRTTFQHLRTMIRSAVADGLVVIDPTMKIKLPVVSSELVVPTVEQVFQLEQAASPMFAMAIVLGARCGLRAGEAQGLRVGDIDFLRRTVNVRVQLVSKPGPHLTEPKTTASVRSIPIPDDVVQVLARHVEIHGSGPDGVLLQERNTYFVDNRFNHEWRRTQVRAGMKAGALRFHWLRHAFASSLISAGCSVKAVATVMGHGSPAVTLSTYASLWPGDEDRVRSAIAATWGTADSLRTTGTD